MESGQFQQLRGMLGVVLTTAGRLEEGLMLDHPPSHSLDELGEQLISAVESLDHYNQKLERLLEQNEQLLKIFENH